MNGYYNVKKELDVRLYCTWMRKDATSTKIDLIQNNTATFNQNISSLQQLKTVDLTGFVVEVDKSILPNPGNVIIKNIYLEKKLNYLNLDDVVWSRISK